MWKSITRWFFSGLAVLVPVLVAIAIIIWAISSLEQMTRTMLLLFIPDTWYLPGSGLVIALILVIALGVASHAWLTRGLISGSQKLLGRIPIFSSIYKPTKDLMQLLKGDFADNLGKPVLIRLPNTDVDTLGFITRNDLSDLPDAFGDVDRLAVYVQWSSQIGGYCFLVPRSSVRELPITVEEGMRWSLTAGLSLRSSDDKQEEDKQEEESSAKDQ